MLVVKPTNVLSTMKTMFRSSTSTYGIGCGRSTTSSESAETKVARLATTFKRAVSR
jgi:hypothetical protein